MRAFAPKAAAGLCLLDRKYEHVAMEVCNDRKDSPERSYQGLSIDDSMGGSTASLRGGFPTTVSL